MKEYIPTVILLILVILLGSYFEYEKEKRWIYRSVQVQRETLLNELKMAQDSCNCICNDTTIVLINKIQ